MTGNLPDSLMVMFFPLRDIAFLLVLVMTIITTATSLLGASQAFRLIPSTIFSTTLCGRRYILQMIKHAVKGLKNVRGNQEAERSLDLKGISTMKQWCHRREIRKKKKKNHRAVELEGTLEMT